jgi:hypothetical protein
VGYGLETTTKDWQEAQYKRDFSSPHGHPAINYGRASGFRKEIFPLYAVFFSYTSTGWVGAGTLAYTWVVAPLSKTPILVQRELV